LGIESFSKMEFLCLAELEKNKQRKIYTINEYDIKPLTLGKLGNELIIQCKHYFMI
jgi:hypothetical protein